VDKLRAIQTFVRIVETGSLTAAADALDTSGPSVVRQLAALERQLGVRLLNRTTRRIALTDEGREYLAQCRRLLADLQATEATLTARHTEPRGRLRITSSVLFGRLHVAPVVIAFLQRYPQVKVELVLLNHVVDLVEEGLDLAIRLAPLPDSSLVSVALGTTSRVLCASPAYLRKHGTPRAPDDLARHRAVGSPAAQTTVWRFRRQGRIAKVELPTVLATNQIDVAIQGCVDGLGCGVFMRYQVDALLKAGKLRLLFPDVEPERVPVHLVYPHARLLSANVRSFVDWAAPRLRKALRD